MDNLKDNKLYCDDQSQRGKTIYDGEYKGYKWQIKTCCSHPTAYVILNDFEIYDASNDDYGAFHWISCHGGITYVNKNT
jgi:hypothetical protein